jgi:hypothetical protein
MYFVYVLHESDTGNPIYVGEGAKNRPYYHEPASVKGTHYNEDLSKKIISCLNRGSKVLIERVYKSSSKDECLDVEFYVKHNLWNLGHDICNQLRCHEKNMSGKLHPMYGLRGKDHPKFGYKHTEEQRENMRKPKSESHKQNMRKPKSKEHKSKIIEASKRRWADPEWRDEMTMKIRESRKKIDYKKLGEKSWETRRRLYGPSGRPKETKEA